MQQRERSARSSPTYLNLSPAWLFGWVLAGKLDDMHDRRQEFDEWIERRAVDYIQPDVTKCGGLVRTRRTHASAWPC